MNGASFRFVLKLVQTIITITITILSFFASFFLCYSQLFVNNQLLHPKAGWLFGASKATEAYSAM